VRELPVNELVIISAIFLKKIGYGMHSDPKFGRRGGGVILLPGEKGSSLCHSEKDSEQRSDTEIPLVKMQNILVAC
jgi:hypothetical protein